jgi:hypothetical protein
MHSVEKMPMMAVGSAPAGGRHRARLVRLANQIVTTRGTTADASVEASCFPLTVDPHDGAISAASVAQLREAISAAVGAKDFQRAADLKQSLDVLAGPGLSVEDALRPTSADERASFFLQNGFVVIPAAFTGAALDQLQTAWLRAQAPHRAAWEAATRSTSDTAAVSALPSGEAKVSGGQRADLFFDIPTREDWWSDELWRHARPGTAGRQRFFELDPCFVNLIDCPPLVDVLERVVGEDVTCTGVQARSVPPAPPGITHAYTSWHRDRTPPDGWPSPRPRVCKAFFFFFGVAEDGGALALVPGSHRLPGQPTQLLSARFAGGSVEDSDVSGHDQTDVLRLDRMPNLLRVAPIPAGSYVMFDNAAWHTAFPNTLPPEIADAMPNHGTKQTRSFFSLQFSSIKTIIRFAKTTRSGQTERKLKKRRPLFTGDRCAPIVYFTERSAPVGDGNLFHESMRKLDSAGAINRPRLRELVGL